MAFGCDRAATGADTVICKVRPACGLYIYTQSLLGCLALCLRVEKCLGYPFLCLRFWPTCFASRYLNFSQHTEPVSDVSFSLLSGNPRSYETSHRRFQNACAN